MNVVQEVEKRFLEQSTPRLVALRHELPPERQLSLEESLILGGRVNLPH